MNKLQKVCVSLGLAFANACTSPAAMMTEDADVLDVADDGTTDRPDVATGRDVSNTDMPTSDVPESDAEGSDAEGSDVAIEDVPTVVDASVDVPNEMDAQRADVPNVDVPMVMDVPNPNTDSGVCPMGTQVCGMMGCVNLRTSVANCGACGNVCALANATPGCSNGACGIVQCNAGFGNCDNNAANGCELNTTNNLSNCGGCGVVCPVPANSTAACVGGLCSSNCSAGFANCDLNPGNGCETPTSNNLLNCGRCGVVCPAVANGAPACTAGVCTATCNAGFEAVGVRCLAAGLFPRPIAPLSLGDVSLRRPTLRWELPAGADGAVVDLCRDRACTMVIESIRAMGTSGRPMLPVPANSVVFWRLRATVGAGTAMTFSPTWLFHVPATDNSGGIDTSSNAHFDVNGDGFDDTVVGAYQASPGGRSGAGKVYVYHGSAMGTSMAIARQLDGVAANSAFGRSVSNAGDVNGDGYGDLIVGAPNAVASGRMFAGQATIYHGGAMGITAPARVLEGGAANDYLGYSVSDAGDVNGDGYADVVVGSYFATPPGRLRAGTASVFHGSAMGIPANSTRVIEGTAADDWFGWSVSTAGDVNGDGFGDIVVSALHASPGGRSRAGTASVFLGNAVGITGGPVRVVEGVAANDALGQSVSNGGDINNDGYSDVVVGAYQADPGGRADAGTVSVFHGFAGGIQMAPIRVLEGSAADDWFGWAVSNAGDVNGDGFGDIIVGAKQASPGGRINAGTASVFLGSVMGVPMAPARVLEGVAGGEFFGHAVSTAGDVNGDGFCDVVVSALLSSPGGRVGVGTVSVFHGAVMGPVVPPARVLEGPMGGELFGASVSSLWDVGGRPMHAPLPWAASRWLRLACVNTPPLPQRIIAYSL